MRGIRSSLFALLALGGSAGIAHAQATPATPPSREAPARREMKADRGGRGLLQGIQLTDAEKTRVEAIHTKYKAQYKSLGESFKPQREAMRAARQRGDTVAVKGMVAKSAEQRERMHALRTQMRGELRAALTPEHQQQLDANVAAREQRMKERAAKASKKGDGRSHRAGLGRRAGR